MGPYCLPVEVPRHLILGVPGSSAPPLREVELLADSVEVLPCDLLYSFFPSCPGIGGMQAIQLYSISVSTPTEVHTLGINCEVIFSL